MIGPGMEGLTAMLSKWNWLDLHFEKKILKIYISINENISKGDVKDVETTF